MSRVFDVSRSGYYGWLNRKPSARAQEDERLKVAIHVAHKRGRESYGARRLQPEFPSENYGVHLRQCPDGEFLGQFEE